MLKAVILAAGNGIRLQPMTLNRPKPLVKIIDKTIIEYNLNELDGLVKEVIIVIGCKGDMIKEVVGDKFKGLKIRYVIQEEQLGTGDAARKASGFLDDKFILLNGDDLYSRKDIKKCLKKYPSILLGKVKNPSCFGVVERNNGFVRNLVEKPEKFPENPLVNTGFYFLDKSIFDFEIKRSPRGEYEFTDHVRGFLLNQRLNYVEAEKWMPVSYPWDLLNANEILMNDLKMDIEGIIEKNCVIKGKVKIEKGATIKSGTYMEGPIYVKKGTSIGPNAFIRSGTIIGENSRIGCGVEVKNSIIGNNVNINHLSYIGDSIIDDNSNIGAGVVLANLRFDDKNIKVSIKGEKIDTGRNKLGSIIGENVKIGINSSLMPGVVINSNSTVMPQSLIKRNVNDSE